MRTSKVFLLGALLFFAFSEYVDCQTNQLTAGSEKRLALVIGNAKYLHSPELSNPVNDARAIRDALQSVGFDVFEFEDASQAQMKMAIDNFGAKLKQYSIGLFFYAGHGIQSKGANFLIPVDANIQSEQQIEYDCVQADRVLGFMEAAGSKINIVILDACRNNPFERSWSRAIDGGGLAFMNAPTGSLIAYSTSPGRTASDGSGSNGLYTSALLENIKKPDIDILKMFMNVRRTVKEKSGEKQIPWESTSLTNDFFFVNKINEKANIKTTWKRADNGGYWFYINDEYYPERIIGSRSENDLLVYDPVTNVTCLLEDYDNKPVGQILDAKVLGTIVNSYWREKDGYYYMYVKGEPVSPDTKSLFVDNDVLVYDAKSNSTYILKDYKKNNDNTFRPALLFDNADFAFWRRVKNSYYFLVKGEYVQDRTISSIVDSNMVVYDTLTRVTYLCKAYQNPNNLEKLKPARIVSYIDNTFWQKQGKAYWLIQKGELISNRTTSRWEGDDLYVTDTKTNITYIFPNYANATENELRVALNAGN
jgi:hypothetical protein